MNILISKFNTQNVSLIIAYISKFPEKKTTTKILSTNWCCNTFRHIFDSVHPALDTNSIDEILDTIEPMTEIFPGLYATTSKCSNLKKIAEGDFINYAMCVNPQLFKLMEVSL